MRMNHNKYAHWSFIINRLNSIFTSYLSKQATPLLSIGHLGLSCFCACLLFFGWELWMELWLFCWISYPISLFTCIQLEFMGIKCLFCLFLDFKICIQCGMLFRPQYQVYMEYSTLWISLYGQAANKKEYYSFHGVRKFHLIIRLKEAICTFLG